MESLNDEHIMELRRSFNAFDLNCSGFIELDELKEGLKVLGYDISKRGIDHLLELVNSKDDKLNFEEFIAWNRELWEDDMKYKFSQIDTDVSGWVSKNELKAFALKMEYSFTEEALDDLTYDMDVNQDGRVGVDEFIKGMAKLQFGNSFFIINGEMYIAKLKADFQAIDTDGNGFITRVELQEMASGIQYVLSEKELEDTMESMDIDRDGKISIEEFIASTIRMKDTDS